MEDTKDIKDLDKNSTLTLNFEVESSSGKIYSPAIRFQNGLKWSSPVKVSCTCADFKYRSAYVLNSYDALYHPDRFKAIFLKIAPDQTNPSYNPQVCKHIVACVSSLENSGYLES